MRVFAAAVGFWLVGASAMASAQITVSMRASATDVRVDDTLQLQISIESESLQNPDVTLPPLDGFTVLQRQVSRPMSFSFSFGGRQQAARSTTTYLFVLQPTREGRITVPAVEARAGNQVFRSNPLTIVVRGGTAPPANDPAPAVNDAPPSSQPASGPIADAAEIDDIAFIRAVADKPEAYVGEQVTVTLYLYLRGNVQAAPSVETQPTTDGFWIHDLLSPNSQQTGHRQVVKGLQYTAYTLRRFAAFPLHEGDLTIGPMAVTLDQSSIFDLFAGRAPASLRRVGQPLVIHAKPLPEAGKPTGEVAVGHFTVEAKLDRNQAATGDAVTLSATVQGSGNIRAVTVATPAVDGLRILEPQVRDVIEAPGDLAGGIRTYEWLVVPERPGTFTLPALAVATFDPATSQHANVKSQPLTLIAAGAAKPQVDATPTPEDAAGEAPAAEEAVQTLGPIRTQSSLLRSRPSLVEAPEYWMGLAALPLVWFLTVMVSVLRARVAVRRAAPNSDRRLRDARKQLDAAAEHKDAAKFYAALTLALTQALENRLGEPIGGYTRRALHDLLLERGMERDLAERVVTLLSRCEQGRFSSINTPQTEFDNTLSEARDCFDQVARFNPRTADAKGART